MAAIVLACTCMDGTATVPTWTPACYKLLLSFCGVETYICDKGSLVHSSFFCSLYVNTTGVGVFSMHPGWADTEGVRTSIPGFHKAFQDKLRSPEEGVDTIVWLALEVRCSSWTHGHILQASHLLPHLSICDSLR